MKKILRTLSIPCLVFLTGAQAYAQCGAGYSQATLNWDVLDYYYNSGSNVSPYGFSGGNYVSNAMEQTQSFVIGTTNLKFDISASGVLKGDNGTHTGDITNYTGNDAQFTPSSNGQTITLTFTDEVKNASFTLYDIDELEVLNISAKDASNNAQNITTTTQGGSILTITGTATIPVITATSSSQGTSSNAGTVTVSVAGPVKTIVITIVTKGTDPTFWLSDVLACTPGNFPTNYDQMVSNRPFTNQPDYFIVTPDNNSVYMVDPATGRAWKLFSEAAGITYVNSLAYDPVNHYLFYVVDGSASPKTNKQLKMYDFNTETKVVLIADITTSLNIPTFDQGVESAGAAYYNGFLYLGIEGGVYSTSNGKTRYSIIYKLTMGAGGVPTSAAQVYATPAHDPLSGSTSVHDWGDFLVKDGAIIDFNTARNGGNYSKSSYVNYDMLSGTITSTNMNTGSSIFSGQAALDWAGNLYTFFASGIAKYNGGGVNGPVTAIFDVTGAAYPGGNGDASENFRPKLDFGDAPASYDPVATSPAVSELDTNIYLGNGYDKEWVSRGQSALANADNYDDALSFTPIFNPLTACYIAQASVFNNSGANATVGAWFDANGNGVFEASEGITVTVPSSATNQLIWLYFPSLGASPLTFGSYTYLRIRITQAANGLTTSSATGFFPAGEVEDYRVAVNPFVLATRNYNFEAQLSGSNASKLVWNTNDETNTASYVLEKSTNGIDWNILTAVAAKRDQGASSYEASDNNLALGITYYRLKVLEKDGTMRISEIRKVDNKTNSFSVVLAPNPAINKSFVHINSGSAIPVSGIIEVLNAHGVILNKQNIRIQKGTNAIELPVVSKLAAGLYIVRVITGSVSNSQTLIINK